MTKHVFITNRGEQPRALSVVGEAITVLASGEDTGGYEVFRQEGQAGQGPPPHSHDWDETFCVVAGEVEVAAGDQTALVKPGGIAHVPANTMHWFRFVTDGMMISVTSRLGASKFFADVDKQVPHGTPDIEKLVAVGTAHGLTLGAPPAAE